MDPEARARLTIDNLLELAGWKVQNLKDYNPNVSLGVAVREFPLRVGEADYVLFVDRQAVGVIEAKPEGTTLGGLTASPGNMPNHSRKIIPMFTCPCRLCMRVPVPRPCSATYGIPRPGHAVFLRSTSRKPCMSGFTSRIPSDPAFIISPLWYLSACGTARMRQLSILSGLLPTRTRERLSRWPPVPVRHTRP